MIYIVTFGAVIVTLVFWIISIQRTFVVFDKNIDNAMLQIDVQLSSRWDALTSLLDLIKVYAEHEYNTLKDTVKERSSITKFSTPDDIKKQLYIITDAMEKIMAVAENYPNLKEDQSYIKSIEAVKQYENMIRTSSLIYNDSVIKLNCAIRMFPVSLIAGILGFSKRACLDTSDKKSIMSDIK